MVLFWCPFKVTKHYKNRGFHSKRGFTICDTYKLCSVENTIFIVFSAKHSFEDMKECNLKKNKNLPKMGVVCQNAKRSLFGMFFCFLVVLFFVACVFVLVFCKKAQKGYFPAILEVFCLFCSHQRPVLKCFFSSYFVFFAFVFPFKNPFLFVFIHQPLFTEDSFWGFFSFSFACLFLS